MKKMRIKHSNTIIQLQIIMKMELNGIDDDKTFEYYFKIAEIVTLKE